VWDCRLVLGGWKVRLGGGGSNRWVELFWLYISFVVDLLGAALSASGPLFRRGVIYVHRLESFHLIILLHNLLPSVVEV
jgi:hypothetical protein